MMFLRSSNGNLRFMSDNTWCYRLSSVVFVSVLAKHNIIVFFLPSLYFDSSFEIFNLSAEIKESKIGLFLIPDKLGSC